MNKKIMFFLLASCTMVGCGSGTSQTSSNASSTPPIDSSSSTTSSSTSSGGNMKTGTYNRPYAANYKEGIPMVDDPHVVYMNWDGFGQYYYDAAIKNAVDSSAPTLSKILNEGTRFSTLENALPSITNPCQTMILTGATSAKTKNVYRYWDRKQNIVIQQQRESEAKSIFQVAVENQIPTVSVRHYLGEQYLTATDLNKLYVTPDSSDPAVVERGSARYEDHFSRMQQLIKVLSRKEFKNGSKTLKYTELPKLTVFYADDLDAIGHNEAAYYGYTVANTEENRMKNVLALLKDMDAKLGDLITKTKAAGTYDQLTFFLTTDHGMQPFGRQSKLVSVPGDGQGKLVDLIYDLAQFDRSYKLARIQPDEKLDDSKTVAGVGMNLNLQLTWRNGITDERLEELKTYLLSLDYIGEVKTRQELIQDGYWTYAADMVVTPKGRHAFSTSNNFLVRGQHDSLLPEAHEVFGVAWGKGIKKNHEITTRAFNYDFGVTIAAALGLVLPDANGICLDVFTKE